MKDCTKKALSATRPTKTAKETVSFCLSQLFKDKTHMIEDEIVKGLTFEELIGALLLAQDSLKIK
jgi:hypothetical protein